MTDYWYDLGVAVAAFMGDDWVSITQAGDDQVKLSSLSNDGLIVIGMSGTRRRIARGVYPDDAHEALRAVGARSPVQHSVKFDGITAPQLIARQILNKIVTPYEEEMTRITIAMLRGEAAVAAQTAAAVRLAAAAEYHWPVSDGTFPIGDRGWSGRVTVSKDGAVAGIELHDLPVPVAAEVLKLLARWR